MRKGINSINNLFDKYYKTKEFENTDELQIVLKRKISKALFNEAVSSLIEIGDMYTTDNVMATGFFLDYFNEANEIPMRKLLLHNFHKSHEDIASLFQWQWNNSTENIPVLLNALENIPKDLEPEDFKYPYVRKIIYAIGAQPQPESLSALEKLASATSDEKTKELALHQLEDRKKSGRWEYERNKQGKLNGSSLKNHIMVDR